VSIKVRERDRRSINQSNSSGTRPSEPIEEPLARSRDQSKDHDQISDQSKYEEAGRTTNRRDGEDIQQYAESEIINRSSSTRYATGTNQP
jgi:hypothetical protein